MQVWKDWILMVLATTMLCHGLFLTQARGAEILPIGEEGPGVGLSWEWINREIKLSGVTPEAISRRYFASGRYGITPWSEIFIRVGLADTQVEQLDSGVGLAYGGGVAVKLYSTRDFTTGLAGQITHFGFGKEETANEPSLDVGWTEYEVVGSLAYRGWERVVPFAGVLFSWISGKIETGNFTISTPFPITIPPSSIDVRERQAVGGVIGIQVKAGQYFYLGVEAKVLDRVSVGIGAGYRF